MLTYKLNTLLRSCMNKYHHYHHHHNGGSFIPSIWALGDSWVVLFLSTLFKAALCNSATWHDFTHYFIQDLLSVSPLFFKLVKLHYFVRKLFLIFCLLYLIRWTNFWSFYIWLFISHLCFQLDPYSSMSMVFIFWKCQFTWIRRGYFEFNFWNYKRISYRNVIENS